MKKCAACRKSWKSAFSQVANEPINVFCAGRTDANVHGTGQVVHFETTALLQRCGMDAGGKCEFAERHCRALGENCTGRFHARFSATIRYRYIIWYRLRPAVLAKGVTHCCEPLDARRMHLARRGVALGMILPRFARCGAG